MAMDTGRPSQRTQRSRKGKKAWRKNIDLDDFEQNLDDQRESEIVLGPQQELFTVDKVGSEEGLTPSMKSEKRLKSHEILNARSAVPALLSHHRKKDKPKHKVMKDRQQLLERAGFTDKSKTIAALEQDGILKSGDKTDLWGDEPAQPTKPAQPAGGASTNVSRTSRAATAQLKRKKPDAPLPGTPAVELPRGGQSYNPALEEWKATIIAEHEKLEEEEIKRVKAEEYQARIDAIIAETEARLADPQNEANDGLVSSSDSESDNENSTNIIGKLSVNPPTQLKRKTQAQRNRERRHKIWLNELSQLKQKKQFMKKLAQEAQKKVEIQQSNSDEKTKQEKKLLRAHSAHPVAPEQLAVKLSDELDDSLRRLKPEGNLIKERMRSLQARGIVEARVPVKKPKNRSKMVEKWSFKHFK